MTAGLDYRMGSRGWSPGSPQLEGPPSPGKKIHWKLSNYNIVFLIIVLSNIIGIIMIIANTTLTVGEGHQQGTVVQVLSDGGSPKPPAERWVVPGFETIEGRAAAASRDAIP